MSFLSTFNVRGYAVGATVAGAGLCFAAYRLGAADFGAQLALGMGTSFLSIAIGLGMLEIFIQRNTQKCAIRAFLTWTYPVLRDRHNLVRDAFWPEFGRAEWEHIVSAFSSRQFDVTTLSKENIRRMMVVLTSMERDQRNICNDMDKFLREMEFLFGWAFDNTILENIFFAKADFRRFKSCDFSNPDHHEDICRSYLCADIHCTELTRQLFHLLQANFEANDRFLLDSTELIGSPA